MAGRTENACNSVRPVTLNLQTELNGLNNEIENFPASRLYSDVFSNTEVQNELKGRFITFTDEVQEINTDFIAEAQEIEIKIETARQAATERTFLPESHIRELREITNKINNHTNTYEAQIAE